MSKGNGTRRSGHEALQPGKQKKEGGYLDHILLGTYQK